MKHTGYLLLALLWFTFSSIAQRTTYNFNTGWKVMVGDDADAKITNYSGDHDWKSVTLPYAWNEDDAFKKDIVDLGTGIAWYRKHFKLPFAAKDQKIFIEFEGVRQAAEIYVNGEYVGMHENGVTAFGFDISSLLKFGNEENVIAVRTDNSWEYKEKATNTKFQWIDKNFNANYGGIPKNVYLHITGKLYQTLPLYSNLGTIGISVFATDFLIPQKSAMVVARSQVRNELSTSQTFTYSVRIKDMTGKLVKTFEGIEPVTLAAGEIKTVSAFYMVSGLNFWSWGYGYLYDVETSLEVNGKVVDKVSTKTGFRKTNFKDGMIRLNDRVIQIHGYAQRTSNEWPAVGMSVPAWLSDYSNKLMIESNGNLVRWMHITPWKQDVESCDRVGLMQAMPAGDAERDVNDKRWEQRKAVMRDAIIYNRNSPSIIFYECGNENISEEHMKEMKAIRDMYDPYGGRAIGSREMLDSKEAEYGGEMLYINKSADIPVWAMEYSRDEGLRKYWDDYSPPYHKDGDGPLYRGQDASTYNRNQESHAKENITRWYEYWKERPGTGKRVSSGGVNIIFSETNTHHRGAENYRRSGEVDALRIPKENFYAHQVMWDGWVDIEKPRIHIVGHWNYTKGVTKDIYVISSADHAELLVNGRSLGNGIQSDRFLFTFKNVKWEKGTITARGRMNDRKQFLETKKTTTGPPAAIRLRSITHPKGIQANGHDLALIEFEIIDQQGNRCPTAMNIVDFELKGEAEWRGGMAQGPDNYILSKSLPAECGVNRVLIRSTTKAGNIIISARSNGLKPAALTLSSVPVFTKDGLSSTLPSYGLTGNLQRGPTPLTPSYTITRQPHTIVKVTAGTNADSAWKSYDDNEMSDWYNDGKLSTAWIEYELSAPSVVTEITLKLNNFRSRTYPLRITVDGIEAFNDTTQRSLGYFTAVCRPVKGEKIRIELVRSSTENGVGKMIEVTGKKLDDGVARDDANAKGTLSIIEAEIYGPVANKAF
jgi:beta-galactosidase